MADLTRTALDLAEQRHGSVPPPPATQKQPEAKSSLKAEAAPSFTPATLDRMEDAHPRPSGSSNAQPAIENIALAEPAATEPDLIQSAISASSATPAEPFIVQSPEL